jgi:c-di-GMP-binding flagellar brake protein YcgR
VNETIFINVDSAEEGKETTIFKSRITDIEEEFLLIEIPMEESSGKLKRLYNGDELSVYYITESGVKHYFNTYVLGFKEDVIRMVRIRKPELEDISTIQRRTFLRVNANLEIAVKKQDDIRFLTHTEDISGGGLSFSSDTKYNLKVGELLSCWVLIHYKNDSIEHIPLKAKIVRISNVEKNRTIIMLKFSEIYDSERQKLIRYCFERQMEFRNR